MDACETQENRVSRAIRTFDAKLEIFTDSLVNEMYRIGHDARGFLAPLKSAKYPFFSVFFLVANITVFAAMAAEFPWYRAKKTESLPPSGFSYHIGPTGLRDFVISNSDHYTFSPPFLMLWGARYNPAIQKGDAYRWFTSLLVHSSFQHLFNNM
jgi:hypothetical protein